MDFTQKRVKYIYQENFVSLALLLKLFYLAESNEDFKLATIVRRGSRRDENEVSVYSSKTNCWTNIGDFPFEGEPQGDGMFTNGAVHWAISQPNIRNHNLI